MTWSVRSIKALTRRTRALKQSRIVDSFAVGRDGRRPRAKWPLSLTKIKLITKLAEVKMVLRSLNVADLMADEPPIPSIPIENAVALPPLKDVEVIEVVTTAVPDPGLVLNPLTCTEIMCSCWGHLAIPVGNLCRLCATTKYSGFVKIDMHGGVLLPKVDAKQQRLVKAHQGAKAAKVAKAKAVKPPPKLKPVKEPPMPKLIKKLKLPKSLPMPTAPTTSVERPRKLPIVPASIPFDWECETEVELFFKPNFVTTDELENLFAGQR